MTYETLLYAVDDGIARVSLNRPAHLNALTSLMVEELLDVIARVGSDDEVRVLLLKGEGRAFCSGADLGSVAAGDVPMDEDGKADIGKPLETHYNPLVMAMQALPKPIIASVNGIAAGAGCSIALMADLTIAARSAKFLQAFVNIGLMPDAGSTWLLPRRVGSQRAMGFAILGKPITAELALEWGLIWDMVEDDQLEAACTQVATQLATGPAVAQARIKQAIQQGGVQSLSEQLHLERVEQRKLGLTHDCMEGVTAFIQKRKAQFKGR
mgnify:FL=1|tara:strand:+ start:846 stop:1649 length:804 start_codon:yes stop_codon:yes gene_type:complete